MKQNISNYILLNRLAEKNLIIDRDLEVLSNEIVSETKLFGLYVYDPEKHVEFHKELISCDVYFDDLLENKFFYFDIINENKINTKNQFDIYSLCQLLEIDYNELPVLIITNNINSNNNNILTDSMSFGQQYTFPPLKVLKSLKPSERFENKQLL